MNGVAGLDLNGLWDWAAIRAGGTGEHSFKDGGVNGAAIRLAYDNETLVVGPQTGLAPHGRGPGWGLLMGDARFRIGIAQSLNAIAADTASEEHVAALVALTNDLALGSRSLVVAVPDDESFDEGARDRFLRLLQKTRSPAVTLLWRSVAATLAWIADGETVPAERVSAARVAVISILRDKIHFSDLTLEVEDTRQGSLVVPVRKEPGRIALFDFGGTAAPQWAARALAETEGLSKNDLLVGMRTLWSVAVGEPPVKELFRLPNRSWRALSVPRLPAILRPNTVADPKVIERLKRADIILIEGPAAGAAIVEAGVLEALDLKTDDPRLKRIGCRAVSRGCLEANDRLRRGDPAYYDFLPQLEINALEEGEPKFVSLIPKDERLRGGAIYRGQAPGQFAIGAGANALTFYLIKEDFEYPRQSHVELGVSADLQHRITVTVEQSPGQGHARVSIGSESFSPLRQNPLQLDWTAMTVVEQARDEIIASLKNEGRVTYPDTQIYPGHPVLWHPEAENGNPIILLRAFTETPLITGQMISDSGRSSLHAAQRIAANAVYLARQAQRLGLEIEESGVARFLGTDGSLPTSTPSLPMPADAASVLDAALKKAALDYGALGSLNDPDPQVVRWVIGFATWCFWRCPKIILDDILDWYDRGELGPTPDQTVRLQGLGRALHHSEDISRFLSILDRRLQNNIGIRHAEYAALGRVLGANDQGGKLLEPKTANLLVEATSTLIEQENSQNQREAYKLKFKYALLMLAVLLRHRVRRPNFLNPRERATQSLLALLENTKKRASSFIRRFEHSASSAKGRVRAKHLAAAARLRKVSLIIDELVYFIHEEGRDPNIIQRIDELDET